MGFPDIKYGIFLVALLMGITLLLGFVIASDDIRVAEGFRDQYTSSLSTRILLTYATDTQVYFLMIFFGNLFLDCMLFFPVRFLKDRWTIIAPVFIVSVIGYNGLLIGSLGYLGTMRWGLPLTLAALLPHGVIELTAMVIAAALGITYALRSMQESGHCREFGSYARVFLTVVTPMVAIAALIEVYVTHIVIYSMA